MNPKIMITIYAIIIAVLLILSFFFSSSDMAYGSVELSRFERDEHKNRRSVKRGYKLSKNYDKTISTILLLNDTVNAGLDTFATLLGINIAVLVLGNGASDSTLEMWGLIASMIALVFKILFGEIIAKSIGKIYNYKLSVAYSSILTFCSYLFFPITYLVSSFGNLVTKPLVKHVNDVTINDDVLHEMVDEITESGSIDQKKADLLHEVVRYTTTEAYECMTPRVDLYAIDIDDDIEDILSDAELYKYTIVPVYQGTIDNVIGVINTKEVMLKVLSGEEVNIKGMLKTPLRFPRSKEVNDILRIFVHKHDRFALIIDEYGGLEGIVTEEDILEEIVGDIWDEKDDPDVLYVEKKDHSYIIDSHMTLKDFCALFDIDYDIIDTEYVTIGGFLSELKDDHFLKVNDTLQFENLKIIVIAVDDNGAVNKIHVIVEEKEEKESFIDKLEKNVHD